MTLETTKSRQFAYLSALFCICQPAGPFMISVYTESLYAYITWSGMRRWLKGERLSAAVWFSLGSLCRGNGVLNAGFFCYDILLLLIVHCRSIFQSLCAIAYSVVLILISVSGFMMFQVYGYLEYCQDGARPWCNRPIPMIYSFVQEHYWNNGLFRYYQLKQLPNFLLATPMIIISVMGLIEYTRRSSASPYHNIKFVPTMVLWGVMLVTCVLTMHVQVITRFMSSMPAMFWYVSQLFLDRPDIRPLLIRYFILYSLGTCVSFALFYPPA
jgi:GPI mannosyltransferase 2